MFDSKALGIASVVWLACAALGAASTVSTSRSSGGTATNPTTTVTITVTAGANEAIKDFHIYPTPAKSKLDGNATFGQPDGWGAPTGTGSNEKGKHWKVNGGGAGFSNGGSGQFTITVPGTEQDQRWGNFRWVTSNDGSSTAPAENGAGFVAGGTTGGADQVPVVSISLSGPDTILLGETGQFTAEAGVAKKEVMSYSVTAALSLDPTNAGRVNTADPLPDSWGVEITTNSKVGTNTIGEGVRQATYFGSLRNHVLVDVPDDPALVGRSFWLQVDFGNGDSTAPKRVTIVSG